MDVHLLKVRPPVVFLAERRQIEQEGLQSLVAYRFQMDKPAFQGAKLRAFGHADRATETAIFDDAATFIVLRVDELGNTGLAGLLELQDEDVEDVDERLDVIGHLIWLQRKVRG